MVVIKHAPTHYSSTDKKSEIRQNTAKLRGEKSSAPEEADAMLVVPVNDAGEGAGVLEGEAADVGQPLVQEGLLDAVAVCEDRWLLLPQLHVQAAIPAIFHLTLHASLWRPLTQMTGKNIAVDESATDECLTYMRQCAQNVWKMERACMGDT